MNKFIKKIKVIIWKVLVFLKHCYLEERFKFADDKMFRASFENFKDNDIIDFKKLIREYISVTTVAIMKTRMIKSQMTSWGWMVVDSDHEIKMAWLMDFHWVLEANMKESLKLKSK